MNLLPELSEIAAAKYGVSLKEPIFRAFDKLVQDSKFNLLKTFIDDDIKEFDITMNEYFKSKTTCTILKDIIDLFIVINGREAFYAKTNDAPTEETFPYWMNRLIEQFMHSSTMLELPNRFTPETGRGVDAGDGIVNGTRMRSAIYNMLDILQNSNSITKEEVSFRNLKKCYIIGRKITKLTIYGNESGVGYFNTSLNKYVVDFKLSAIVYDEKHPPLEYYLVIGDSPLYEGESIELNLESTAKITAMLQILQFLFHIDFSYLLKPDKIIYDLYSFEVKDYNTDVEIFYTATRDHYTPNVDDYIYETFGENNEYIKTLSYVGSDTELIVPEHFTSLNDTLKTIGEFTFYKTDVKRVGIPEGVETIE